MKNVLSFMKNGALNVSGRKSNEGYLENFGPQFSNEVFSDVSGCYEIIFG
jgi:hypothetical protein